MPEIKLCEVCILNRRKEDTSSFTLKGKKYRVCEKCWNEVSEMFQKEAASARIGNRPRCSGTETELKMSLACLECRQIGTFDTLILFEPGGKFDLNVPTSSYRNYYTCCATLDDFKGLSKSRFLIVKQPQREDAWNTGHDGPTLGISAFRYVDEAELKRRLPKIYEELAQERS